MSSKSEAVKTLSLLLTAGRPRSLAPLTIGAAGSDVAKCLNHLVNCGVFCSCHQHFGPFFFLRCNMATDVTQMTAVELGGPIGKSSGAAQNYGLGFSFHSDRRRLKRKDLPLDEIQTSLLIYSMNLKYDQKDCGETQSGFQVYKEENLQMRDRELRPCR